MAQSFPANVSGHSGQWSDITAHDHSCIHVGHKFRTTNIYHASPPTEVPEEETKTNAIIDRLYYPELEHREKQIDDSARDTFGWAFDDESVPLRNWLIAGHGMFWVSGKPGSGKSTFMKFLSRHPKTQALLSEWAGGKPVILASHYFWHAGTRSSLEKNEEGLYRDLLYQITNSSPGLIPILLPDRWSSCKKPVYRQPEWTTKELLTGLHLLSTISDTVFVMFVDGLDECHPPSEHSTLLSELQQLSSPSNVKLCVSSRPWKPFEPRLGLLDRCLTMQNLTYGDMVEFIIENLCDDVRGAGVDVVWSECCDFLGDSPDEHVASASEQPYQDLTGMESEARERSEAENKPVSNQSPSTNVPVALQKFASKIASRSEGVFLWVRLVLRDLREEIFAGRSLSELGAFLEEVPSGLLEYYKEGIWKRIDWRREQQVAMAFRIAAVLAPAIDIDHCPKHFLSFVHFWYLQHYSLKELQDPRFAIRAPIQTLSWRLVEQMRFKTTAFLGQICKDLIQVENVDQKPYSWPSVKFLHRSVVDFLTDPETQGWTEERVPRHFRKPEILFELTLLRLKLVTPQSGLRDIEQSQWDLYENLEFMGGQFKEGPYHRTDPAPREFHSVPTFRAGIEGLTIDLASQYEALAIHYLRARDDSGFYCKEGSGSSYTGIQVYITRLRQSRVDYFVACFTSFGLATLIREIATRCPSTFSDRFQHSIFNIVPRYLVDEFNQYVTVEFLKNLLDLGLLCSTESWHILLYYLWNCNVEKIKPCIWPIAKLFIASGVDMKGELCLAHPPPAARATCEDGCVFRSVVDLLHALVPENCRAEFSELLHNYKSTAWLRNLANERRKRCCALYRAARKVYLKATTESLGWSLSTFELEYAEWVYQHERERLGSQRSREYFHPLKYIRCEKCGIDIHSEGCLNWFCLSCLERDYCTFCVPLVRDVHVGEFQCTQISIGAHAVGRGVVGTAIS